MTRHAPLAEQHNRSHTSREFLLRVQIRYRKSMTHTYSPLRSDGNRVALPIRSRLGACPLRLSDIARDFGVSERRLRETSDPIGKIALSCGFASPQTFARSFADTYGQSPSAHPMKNPRSDRT